MKSAIGALVAIGSMLLASPSQAQNINSRDGVFGQAVTNTVAASLQRRGYATTSPEATATLAAVNDKVVDLYNQNTWSGEHNWWTILLELRDDLPWPFDIGSFGEPYGSNGYGGGLGGGSFGGGGATGSWTSDGPDDCGEFDFRLDAAGTNLIVPSYPLKTGGSMQVGTGTYRVPRFTASLETDQRQIYADSREAVVRRMMHNENMHRPTLKWFGVVGPWANNPTECTVFATVGYLSTSGGEITREEIVACTQWGGYAQDTNHDSYHDQPCPLTPTGGSDFHFYGYNGEGGGNQGWSGNHLHECVWYIPNEQLAPGGYAINPETSIPWHPKHMKANLPVHVAHCSIDPSLIRKVADRLYKRASDEPDYDGAPYSEVKDEDVRDNGAQVRDLTDNPTTGNSTSSPDSGVDDPPPTTNTTTTNNYQDVCDFGVGGCDNPNVGDPDLEDVPDGIMDPIFEWLPDLPSLTLTDQSATCPVWNINLTDVMGPNAQYLLNSHCTLVEYDTGHGTVRSILSALMIGIWGIAAAIVILRA